MCGATPPSCGVQFCPRAIAKPRGDATLGSTGSTGGFRSDGEIEAMREAADAAAEKLRRLPKAMRPDALAAAGQQGGAAFAQGFGTALTTGVRDAFAAAEQEARAGAARLGAIGNSVKVRPARVNADRGRSFPHMVNADVGYGEPELGGWGYRRVASVRVGRVTTCRSKHR